MRYWAIRYVLAILVSPLNAQPFPAFGTPASATPASRNACPIGYRIQDTGYGCPSQARTQKRYYTFPPSTPGISPQRPSCAPVWTLDLFNRLNRNCNDKISATIAVLHDPSVALQPCGHPSTRYPLSRHAAHHSPAGSGRGDVRCRTFSCAPYSSVCYTNVSTVYLRTPTHCAA